MFRSCRTITKVIDSHLMYAGKDMILIPEDFVLCALDILIEQYRNDYFYLDTNSINDDCMLSLFKLLACHLDLDNFFNVDNFCNVRSEVKSWIET